jgi:NDP-sugar pyrophosphorylase family protein
LAAAGHDVFELGGIEADRGTRVKGMDAVLEGVSAAILAGGLGTRLRSVIPDRPKVLAPVLGRPFLTYLLDQLVAAGITETVLLVGYAADRVRSTLGGDYRGMRLSYSVETDPLGTGGAVRLAVPQLREQTTLLLNGDSYCDVELAHFLEFHRRTKARASLALAEVSDTSRYGSVFTDPGGRVVGFEEKGGARSPGRINAGVYLLQRDLLDHLPKTGRVSLEKDILPRWVGTGGVWGFGGGRFIDIGTPGSYAAADTFFDRRG